MKALSSWVRSLSPIVKGISTVGVLLAAGWTGHVAFSQQVGLPSVVGRTVERIGGLEDRMHVAEEEIDGLQASVPPLLELEDRVDSLYVLQAETYCIVRAHALDLDPLRECTLNRRGGF